MAENCEYRSWFVFVFETMVRLDTSVFEIYSVLTPFTQHAALAKKINISRSLVVCICSNEAFKVLPHLLPGVLNTDVRYLLINS